MRDKPGTFGLVGANGGIMSKYSVGIYSTEPADWVADRSKELQQDIAALPKVAVTRNAEWHGDHRDVLGALRLAGHARGSSSAGSMPTAAGSWPLTDDDDLVALMTDGDPLGARDIGDVRRQEEHRLAGVTPSPLSLGAPGLPAELVAGPEPYRVPGGLGLSRGRRRSRSNEWADGWHDVLSHDV